MNVEQRQAAADPQNKPPDLGCESACKLLYGAVVYCVGWRAWFTVTVCHWCIAAVRELPVSTVRHCVDKQWCVSLGQRSQLFAHTHHHVYRCLLQRTLVLWSSTCTQWC